MSQAGKLAEGSPTIPGIETLTGNSGGAVPGAGIPVNVNVVGQSGQINVVGNPGTSTLTISLVGGGTAMDSFQPDSGTNPVVPDSNGLVVMAGSGSITTVGSLNTLTTQLTGLTNHNVLVGAGTTTITKVAPPANLYPLVSAGAAADPAFSLLTVPGGGTGIGTATAYAPICGGTTGTGAFQSAATNIANTGYVLTSNGNAALPSFQALSGLGAILTITGNSGGAESPSAGNFNIVGTGSITVAGSAATETVQLTGLTNHAVLVGAGSATITNVGPTSTAGQVLQSAGAAADPAFSTATYPLTTTVSQILYSSATNTVTGLATANRGVLTTGATGVPAITALATDGQLIIGSTAGAPAAATLTAGTGVTITNASNSITINAAGGGMSWSTLAGTTQAAAVNNGYISGNAGATTITLPATYAIGDTVAVEGLGAGGWILAANTGDTIQIGAAVTSSGGTLTSAAATDNVYVTAIVANTTWRVRSTNSAGLVVA